jgi:hypothetical protein
MLEGSGDYSVIDMVLGRHDHRIDTYGHTKRGLLYYTVDDDCSTGYWRKRPTKWLTTLLAEAGLAIIGNDREVALVIDAVITICFDDDITSNMGGHNMILNTRNYTIDMRHIDDEKDRMVIRTGLPTDRRMTYANIDPDISLLSPEKGVRVNLSANHIDFPDYMRNSIKFTFNMLATQSVRLWFTEVIGVSLFFGNVMKAIIFFLSGGNDGKTTLGSILGDLIGNLYQSCYDTGIMKGSGNAPSSQIMEMIPAAVINFPEARLDQRTAKLIGGKDAGKTRNLYESESTSFTLEQVAIMQANEFTSMFDSFAAVTRLIFPPMGQQFQHACNSGAIQLLGRVPNRKNAPDLNFRQRVIEEHSTYIMTAMILYAETYRRRVVGGYHNAMLIGTPDEVSKNTMRQWMIFPLIEFIYTKFVPVYMTDSNGNQVLDEYGDPIVDVSKRVKINEILPFYSAWRKSCGMRNYRDNVSRTSLCDTFKTIGWNIVVEGEGHAAISYVVGVVVNSKDSRNALAKEFLETNASQIAARRTHGTRVKALTRNEDVVNTLNSKLNALNSNSEERASRMYGTGSKYDTDGSYDTDETDESDESENEYYSSTEEAAAPKYDIDSKWMK